MSPLWEGTSPCWEVRCDECGEGEGHFDTKRELLERIEHDGWLVVDVFVNEPAYYCDRCASTVCERMRALRMVWLNE